MKKLLSRSFLLMIGAVFISFLFGNVASQCFAMQGYSVPVLIPSVVIFLTFFIPKNVGVAAFAGAVDMTALAAELRDYALENKTGIFSKIVNSAMFSFMTPIGDVLDKVPLIELLVGDILQPGGKSTFNPTTGAVKFKNRYGQVRPGKADLQFTQENIQQMKKSWLGVLAKSLDTPTPLDVYSFPFEAYVFQKIAERFGKNLRTALIKGVYNAAGTSKLDVMDGLLTIVDADRTAGVIPGTNMFAGAPITANNAEAQIVGVAEKTLLDEEYAGAEMVMLIAPENKYYYELNYRTNHGTLPYNQGFDQQIIPGFNIRFEPIPEMTGSDSLIVTPAENLVMMYDDLSRASNMIVEREKRNLNVLMDIELGTNYAIAETVWTNDQD